MTEPTTHYIGDGVYAKIEEYGTITLYTDRAVGQRHYIVLERSKLMTLLDCIAREHPTLILATYGKLKERI